MKTRHDLILDFMLALSANPAVLEEFCIDDFMEIFEDPEDARLKMNESIASHVHAIASELANKCLGI